MYDVVIVGSGFGGLSCGLILSKEGYKVCILEKNRQIGGSLQIFSRDKTVFDTGIHYIGGLSPGQNLHQIMTYFGIMDKLKLKQLDIDGYDLIRFKNDPVIYPHAQGYENFIRVLSDYFPSEKDNIRAYTEEMQTVCDSFPVYRLRHEDIDIFNSGHLTRNAAEVIAGFTQNDKLRQVLAGSNAIYAGNAKKTPFYQHALSVNSYIESSWKCVDGSSQITRLMSEQIKALGGTILNYSEAVKFRFEGSDIVSVELKNGECIEGRSFISNIDLTRTMQMIEEGKIRNLYKNRLMSLENSISAFLLNIVLKPQTMKAINHNAYMFESDNVWESIDYAEDRWPESMALFCPAISNNNGYAKNLTLMSYMRYEEMKPWMDSFRTIPRHTESRGEDYEEFKTRKAEKMLDNFEQYYPGFRQNIQSYTASTPLTYRDYIGSTDGTLYGVLKDCNDPVKTFITPRTKVPNLFLTGQNMNFHGVLGVAINAIKTCSEFVGGEYLLKKINEA